jgi:beta-glucosidase
VPLAVAPPGQLQQPQSARVAWPSVRPALVPDPQMEAEIGRIIASMTTAEKVAQMIQPDIGSITPDDVQRYRFGSILNGGNSAPYKNETGPASDYLKLADQMWEAAMDPSNGKPPIPMLWGTDAVHGHSNVVGATLFPHNIGLGAMRNPELIRRIGEITALEVAVTGIDWTFAPTLAVVRDDRWGRTYEGYSEDPEIVRSYAGAMVEGLQGRAGTPTFLAPGKALATAKHFVGDGGTLNGKDQGDNLSSDEQLRDIHGAGYPPALAAGAQTVMVSYSSVRGLKMHGHRHLLTGALKGDMGFDGLLVGDWNGHGQVQGCTNTSCAQAINAGLDMFMAPDSWKGLYETTLAQVNSGVIPMGRIDDAVRRILRVKMRAGLFTKGKPSSRRFAGRYDLLGTRAHRQVAREAVRQSIVLLKNDRGVLPLRADSRVLVAGDGALNIPKQSGGWTLTWQGTDTANKDFPNAQSIFSGIRQAVRLAGGSATLSRTGVYTRKPDVAIVVFGENPYAEGEGDRSTLEFSPANKKDLALLRRLKAAGIPVVSVFLSGRPMWVNPEINASDAFVAGFLPGSEGGGIADVLFRNRRGEVRHDFRGKLSFSWPRCPSQTPLNRGDPGYAPQFPYGYGLTYAGGGTDQPVGQLPTLAQCNRASRREQ